jgi:hypothetical protein
METLKQHHDSPVEDVSAEDNIEAAASTRLWEGKHVSRCPVSDQSGQIVGRVQALKRVPAYFAAPPRNGVYVLVWWGCPTGLAAG